MGKNKKIVLISAFLCFFAANAHALRLFHDVEIKLHGGAYATYDDNITYVKDNKVSDFYFKPSVGASLLYEGKTTTISATGNYYHEFYVDHSGFDNNAGDVTAALASELSKYDRITLSDTWSRTYEPRSFEDQFGFIGGRYSSDRNRVNFGYARDVTEHFGLSTRYSNEYNTYSRSDISKSFLNSGGVEASYILSTDFTIFTAYDFTRRDFVDGPHATTNTWTGGFRKFLTKQLYVDASTGVDFIRSYGGSDFTKPFGVIALTDDISDRTNASLLFSKRFNTISYAEDLFDQWQISGRINHDITQKLKGTVSAFYGRGEYINSGEIDDLVGTSAGLEYEINDKWKARAAYSFSNQDSNSSFSEYRKNTVTFGLSTEY